jgi:GTP-binding protein
LIVRKAIFNKSSAALKECPKPTLPEYAFIGRSNVGKSSLINMLCNNNKLAKTSATPGKTQLINHFLINENWYLVDLPGYGFAKTAKTKKAEFEKIIIDYITKRDSLVCLFVLIDSRLPLQQIDAEFLQWLGTKEVPFCILYTKADKLSKKQLKDNVADIEKRLSYIFDELPNSLITSSQNKTGKEDVLEFIEAHFSSFPKK